MFKAIEAAKWQSSFPSLTTVRPVEDYSWVYGLQEEQILGYFEVIVRGDTGSRIDPHLVVPSAGELWAWEEPFPYSHTYVWTGPRDVLPVKYLYRLAKVLHKRRQAGRLFSTLDYPYMMVHEDKWGLVEGKLLKQAKAYFSGLPYHPLNH